MKIFKLLIIGSCAIFLSGCTENSQPTDYEIEIAQISDAILKTKTILSKLPDKNEQLIKLVGLLYLRASITGNFDHYKITETLINNALQEYGPSLELYYYRAHLNFKLHRIQNAKSDLKMLSNLTNMYQIGALKADIALQEGRYGEAEKRYEVIIKNNRTWDNLARHAYLKSKTGDLLGAEKLYEEAIGEITSKEMRSYAWIELQRGLLDLEYERYEEAFIHYGRASNAYSGYWLIEEHIAEALGLLGETHQAIDLYLEIIKKTENSEILRKLAKIVENEDSESAANFLNQADKLYARQFNLYPEAIIGHLTEHLLEKKNSDENQKLLEFANRNYQLRPNSESKLLLARTYLKLNDVVSAKKLINEILQTPWRTPEISKILNEIDRARVKSAQQSTADFTSGVNNNSG